MHKIAALLAAIAAFAMASHQDYVDAELVSHDRQSWPASTAPVSVD